jgi:hypothetical protein
MTTILALVVLVLLVIYLQTEGIIDYNQIRSDPGWTLMD